MHHPRKLFPRFLLFAAKNTTALLFCQTVTSASSSWLLYWFVSQTEESIIYKDTRNFWSFQLYRNQEFTKTQPEHQETWKCHLSTWAFTYKITVKGMVFLHQDEVCPTGCITPSTSVQGLTYGGGHKPQRDTRDHRVKPFSPCSAFKWVPWFLKLWDTELLLISMEAVGCQAIISKINLFN